MVTYEQRSFYLITTFPYFALALAVIFWPLLQPYLEALGNEAIKRLSYAAIICMGAVIAVSVFARGRAKRDRDILHDVYAISTIVPPQTIISVPEYFKDEWSTMAYFTRYGDISLDPYKNNHDYHLQGPEVGLPPHFSKVEVPLKNFVLLKKDPHP